MTISSSSISLCTLYPKVHLYVSCAISYSSSPLCASLLKTFLLTLPKFHKHKFLSFVHLRQLFRPITLEQSSLFSISHNSHSNHTVIFKIHPEFNNFSPLLRSIYYYLSPVLFQQLPNLDLMHLVLLTTYSQQSNPSDPLKPYIVSLKTL